MFSIRHHLTNFVLALFAAVTSAQAGRLPANPDCVVDLASAAGMELMHAEWRTNPVRVIEVDHHAPGPDLRPSGAATRTNDIEPRAGSRDFDDAKWERISPDALDARRSTGRLAFQWYRTRLTIPAKLGDFDPTGASIVLELVADDYAEIWVDGKLPQVLGQSGGALIAGWNTPNRVVLTRSAKPGQQFQVAIFAANGPLSDPPTNFVWLRSATLDLYAPQPEPPATEALLTIDRRDPALDAIVPPSTRLERIATGFTFTEGPVWVPTEVAGAGAAPLDEGYLLFSDPNRNLIYRCSGDGDVSIYRAKSGYTGLDIGEYRQPGSNGLTLDDRGRLTICEHGNRRITRLEANGSLTTLADKYAGKRLNSPNDLVYRSDGALYFTDPVFGLPKFGDDPRRESPDTGVYCLVDGTLRLVATDLSGPNGLAFSPDEKTLYIGNWDDKRKIVMRYDVAHDGQLRNGRVFHDMTGAPGEDAIDGIKVDQRGNVFVSGPGGLWVLGPDGRHLGTLRGPEHPHNIAFGDDDGQTLFWAAQTSIYRMRTGVAGIRPHVRQATH